MSLALLFKQRLKGSLDSLPMHLKKKFKESLVPHKFAHELYVPKNINTKTDDTEKKKSLKNRWLEFNDAYNEEKNRLNQMQKDSKQFGYQYSHILQANTENPKSITNQYSEVFKKRGYNINNLDIKENVFMPSLLLELESNYMTVLPSWTETNVLKDVQYLRNCERAIEQKEHPNSTTANNMKVLASATITNSETLPDLMVCQQLIEENDKIRNEISILKQTINDDHLGRDSLRELPWKDKIMHEEGIEYNKNLQKINGIFLSSKGMLRSAKRRVSKKYIKATVNIHVNKSTVIPNKHWAPLPKNVWVNHISNKMKEIERINTWECNYNSLKQSDLLSKEWDVKNYIARYRKEKKSNLSLDAGANWHGFWGDFKKHTQIINIPELSKKISLAQWDFGGRRKSNNNEKWKEFENNILALDYNYIGKILKGKN